MFFGACVCVCVCVCVHLFEKIRFALRVWVGFRPAPLSATRVTFMFPAVCLDLSTKDGRRLFLGSVLLEVL